MTHLMFVLLAQRLRAEGDEFGAAALCFLGVLHAYKEHEKLRLVAGFAKGLIAPELLDQATSPADTQTFLNLTM